MDFLLASKWPSKFGFFCASLGLTSLTSAVACEFSAFSPCIRAKFSKKCAFVREIGVPAQKFSIYT